MQKEKILLTTVIVNWNTSNLLRECLKTLIESTATPQVIWIVDNASSDDSVEMVRREFPQVHLEASPVNLGFAAANNLALRLAEPTLYVLLLNPDTEVLPGAVDNMVECLQNRGDVGAVGVQLLNPDRTFQRSFGFFYNFAASFWRNSLVKNLFKLNPGTVKEAGSEMIEVDWIIGACLMLRSKALEETGLLDERFFMYGEETDLQWRLAKAGWKRILLPGVNIIHYGGQSSRQAYLKMMIQEYRSRYLLVRKHNSQATRFLYLCKALSGLGFWTVYWGVQSISRRDNTARSNCHTYSILFAKHLTSTFYAVNGQTQVLGNR